MAPGLPEPFEEHKTKVGSVAGHGFGSLFSGLRCRRTVAVAVAVAIRMAVTISVASSWGDAHRLAGVGEVLPHSTNSERVDHFGSAVQEQSAVKEK